MVLCCGDFVFSNSICHFIDITSIAHIQQFSVALWLRKISFVYCCIIGQQTNVDWIRVVMVSLVSNETNTDVRMYT